MLKVVGSINLDETVALERFPSTGETVSAIELSLSGGGKGANQAIAAHLAGASVELIGAVGRDAAAQQAVNYINKIGLRAKLLECNDYPTGRAIIFVDKTGDNIITVISGANEKISTDHIDQFVANISKHDTLLLQQEIPYAINRRALRFAAEKEAFTVLNISPFSNETYDLAPLVSMIVANEHEASLLLDANLEDLAPEKILSFAKQNNQEIVVTFGEKGAVAATPKGVFSSKAPPIKPKNTVGAGDAFCGYLCAELDMGRPLQDALDKAVSAGSKTCLANGAQESIPRSADIEIGFRT